MSYAALVWIVLAGIGVGMDITRHGKAKTGNHNAWSSAIAAVITAALLAWGGFFARH